MPWHPTAKQNARAAKIKRLKQKGLLPAQNKEIARTECAAAAKQHIIKRLPTRRRASVIIDKLVSK